MKTLVISVEDDGRGMDPLKISGKALELGLAGISELEKMSSRERLQLIFKPGFSTAEEVSDVSGRGVGMDAILDKVQKASGKIKLFSVPNQGSKFLIFLPLRITTK